MKQDASMYFGDDEASVSESQAAGDVSQERERWSTWRAR